jgi:hypothetical protein
VDLRVTVHNLTGHKFPTGHPYRRAWLHVRIKDNKGRTVFESGAPDASGHISGGTNGYSPHYDLITLPQQVQVYQTVMGDTARQTTWSLLRAADYLKDNRLPPKGFSPSQEDAANVAVRGAETDPNFHAGRNGADEVTYRFEAPPTAVSLIAEIELLYQSVPPDSVARLLKAKGVEAKAFARVYRGMDKRPECAGRVSLSL